MLPIPPLYSAASALSMHKVKCTQWPMNVAASILNVPRLKEVSCRVGLGFDYRGGFQINHMVMHLAAFRESAVLGFELSYVVLVLVDSVRKAIVFINVSGGALWTWHFRNNPLAFLRGWSVLLLHEQLCECSHWLLHILKISTKNLESTSYLKKQSLAKDACHICRKQLLLERAVCRRQMTTASAESPLASTVKRSAPSLELSLRQLSKAYHIVIADLSCACTVVHAAAASALWCKVHLIRMHHCEEFHGRVQEVQKLPSSNSAMQT